MRKNTKRLIALLMTITMILAVCPVEIFAAGDATAVSAVPAAVTDSADTAEDTPATEEASASEDTTISESEAPVSAEQSEAAASQQTSGNATALQKSSGLLPAPVFQKYYRGSVAASYITAAVFEGEGTAEQPYLIGSSAEWDALSSAINSGSTAYAGKYFKLTDDITVTTMLGYRPGNTDNDDYVFSGTFDGAGHTLNVNINTSLGFAAPFAIAHNAVIKNLTVTGTVTSTGFHATGLVGASKAKVNADESSLTIQNVTVSTDVSCTSHIAGIIGHAHQADITMENVVFDGSLNASSVQGGFIGWGGAIHGFNASFKDCLFKGTYNSGAAFYPIAFASGQGTVTLINDFYTTSFGSGGSPITPTGSGSLKIMTGTRLISSASDWNEFADAVLAGETFENYLVKLTDDITVTRGIGSGNITSATAPVYPFSGTFDGCGHTLNFVPPADTEANYVAPFSIVKNATVTNLKVTGKVTAYNNISGLVGSLIGTLLIENVISDVDVSGNFVGGFIGHGSAGNITVRNSAYTGDLNGSTLAGGIICWRGPTAWDPSGVSAVHMENCLFAGRATGTADFHPIGFTQQTNVPSGFTNMWSSVSPKNNSKGFYNYQYQGASYKPTVAVVTSKSDASGTRPWMGYYDVTAFMPTEGALAEALNAWTGAEKLFLLGDATANTTATVPSGEHTLDLNGHTLKAGSAGYSVITVGSGAELVIDDTAGGGKITGGSVGQNYGGGITADGGKLTLKGGAISGNANTYGAIGYCSGGVLVKNSGKFYMEGGEISANTSYVGGGVCCDTSATTVIITGGEIKNNKITRFGSGVLAGRSSSATFKIGGDAKIVDNISTWTSDKNGEASVNFSKLSISGNPTVRGCWKTTGNSAPNAHINLDNDGSSVQRIALDGALTNESGTPNLLLSPIYRWNDLQSGKTFVFTSGWSTYMGTAHPADYFGVDASVSGVRIIRKDGEAAFTGSNDLGDLYITYNANGGTGEMEAQLVSTTSAVLNQNSFTNGNKEFIGWNTKADGSGTPYSDKGDITLSGDVTLYAQWAEKHEHDDVTFTKWEQTSSLPTKAGDYYLGADVTISSTWNVPSGTVNLCLNGHGIKMVGSGSVINVGSSAVLNVYDCGETEHKFTVNSPASNGAGCAIVNDSLAGDYKTFTGGYITGGNAREGGGIHVQSGAHFTLYGGTVIGNRASFMGAGIKISNGSDTTGECFTMAGGAVMYNYLSGWGAGLNSDGSITMTGGTIAYNYATKDPGGIHCHYLYMSGGSIVNNYADDNEYSAGVHADHEVFISGNPVISDNVYKGTPYNLDWDRTELAHGHKLNITGALSEGAQISVTLKVGGTGVFTNGWKANMGDADPAKYFTSDNRNYSVFLNQGGEAEIGVPSVASIISGETVTNYGTLADAISAWTAGSTLKLLADVTTSSTVTAPSGEHTLDLNGHGIKMTGNNRVFMVGAGATLNMKDSGEIEHKFVVDSPASNGAGLAVVDDTLTSGYKTFTGGYITGGNAQDGAGVYVTGGGKFNMYGGTILGNMSSRHGGGVNVSMSSDGSEFNMYGGSVCYNSAAWGGGINIFASARVSGESLIENNVASNGGGGIELESGGRLYMNGGTVTENRVLAQNGGMWKAGGVHVPNGTEYHLQGAVRVINNYEGASGTTQNNVFVRKEVPGKVILDGALAADASIGAGTNGAAPFTLTSAYNTHMGEADPTKYFTSDNADYTVILKDGEAALEYTPVPDVSASGYTGDYDGAAHGIAVSVPTGATVQYGTKAGDYSLTENPSYTDAGTYNVYYKVTMDKHTPVEGSAVVTINQINATVTITGHNTTVNYDGKAHSADGFDFAADTTLYTAADFTFSGRAEAVRTDAGTTNMELAASQFVNTNENFATVTFNVSDGFVKINPINVTVTITGHNVTANYDAKAHSAEGYDFAADSTLYTEADFTFSGNAAAERTDAGKTDMGLTAAQFSNTNPNFATVTFNVTDGFVKIDPIDVTVTITGHHTAVDYDGETHSADGYDFAADNALYTEADFTFSGRAEALRTNAGTTYMGLTASQFKNTNKNFATVVFDVSDGFVKVNQINAVVTIKGHHTTADYDGNAYSAAGYDFAVDTALYTEADFIFSGNAAAERREAGTTKMGLNAAQFENTNENFATVTFNVTDGYVTINPITAVVTITGHTNTAPYNGKAHIVSGYDASANTALYDVEKDFAFTGSANAVQTDAGTAKMGLTSAQFKNTNQNFASVIFKVTDGYQKITRVDAVIKSAPHAKSNLVYSGETQALIVAGSATGGTLYYAIGADDTTAPASAQFKKSLPAAKDIGNYYIWYKVIADKNHNSLAPKCFKVTLANQAWLTVNGKILNNDKTPMSGAEVLLMRGNEVVDTITSNEYGEYYFTVAKGVYNLVVKVNGITVTNIADVTGNVTTDITLPAPNTDSVLDIVSDKSIAVGGLEQEANLIRQNEKVPDDVNVTVKMTVQAIAESDTDGSKAITSFAKDKYIEFYDLSVEKTVGSVTTKMNTTQTVMEIVIPCSFTNKRELQVFTCDGGDVTALTESDSGAPGTYRVDAENGLIYIYTTSFATVALAYQPYFSVSSLLSLGSYTGKVSVKLEKESGDKIFELNDVSVEDIAFKGVPRGTYTMTVQWVDGVENTITLPFNIK